MSVVGQFLLNNLLPALVAGSLAWAFVHLAVHLLGIRHGKLRLCPYLAPLLKSTLVLLGLGLVLAWPRELFSEWAARAVPSATVVPIFLLLTGVALIARMILVRRAERSLLAGSTPAPAQGRLNAALDEVMAAYRARAGSLEARCELEALPTRPRLLQREDGLRSPAVVVAEEPTIVFPTTLLSRLDDADLRAALAHEVAHVYLRQPGSCYSSETVRIFSALNPFAGVIAAQLHREEEKACDDVAVDVFGDSDAYAGMLLRSYRFAAAAAGPLSSKLQFVPQLLGVRPMLSERVEHLMARDASRSSATQRLAFAGTWIALISLFFVF